MGRIQKILVPVDFGDASVAALRLGATWASATGLPLEVLHVIDTPAFLSGETAVSFGASKGVTTFDQVVLEEAMARMEVLLAKIPSDLGITLHEKIARGDPLTTIVGAATGDEIIIVGTHAKPGLGRWMLGTLADKLMRSVDGPVMTVHDTDEARVPKRILVAIDGSDGARAALIIASALADLFHAKITTAHVVSEPSGLGAPGLFVVNDDDGERTTIEDHLRTRASEKMSPFVRSVLRDRAVDEIIEIGTAKDVLPVLAEEADIVVMGTRGMTGLERFALGSVAACVVRQAPCPVLTVRRTAS